MFKGYIFLVAGLFLKLVWRNSLQDNVLLTIWTYYLYFSHIWTMFTSKLFDIFYSFPQKKPINFAAMIGWEMLSKYFWQP